MINIDQASVLPTVPQATLQNDEKDVCEKSINESEILKSIKNLSNGKIPGSDGLPTNFYKFVLVNINPKYPICYVSWRTINRTKERYYHSLTPPPPQKNRLLLKNW